MPDSGDWRMTIVEYTHRTSCQIRSSTSQHDRGLLSGCWCVLHWRGVHEMRSSNGRRPGKYSRGGETNKGKSWLVLCAFAVSGVFLEQTDGISSAARSASQTHHLATATSSTMSACTREKFGRFFVQKTVSVALVLNEFFPYSRRSWSRTQLLA